MDPARAPRLLEGLLRKEIHLWIGAWLKDAPRRKALRERTFSGPRHLIFATCDHYEPLHGKPSHETGRARVQRWRTDYPKLAKDLRDANGRPPRHSFFFPGEEYHREFLEPLRELVELGYGEAEVHLHHDRDTRESVREKFVETLELLARHDLVVREGEGYRWAFIHGNWSLANGRRDGMHCGVDDELELLYELGCYADFTFPSAPDDECQPAILNSIYYPDGDLSKKRAYEHGTAAKVGDAKRERVLLIEGPLAMSLRRAKNPFRVESASLQASDPPTKKRLDTWIEQGVSVRGREEWVFVKVHTHGAPEKNADVLLGDPARRFHEDLLRHYNDGTRWQTHYVTAREMFNVARAAMDGKDGSPAAYFDYEIPRSPASARAPR